MAQVRIWIHTVWGTKNRTPFMQNKSKRIDLFKHIKSNAKEKVLILPMKRTFLMQSLIGQTITTRHLSANHTRKKFEITSKIKKNIIGIRRLKKNVNYLWRNMALHVC